MTPKMTLDLITITPKKESCDSYISYSAKASSVHCPLALLCPVATGQIHWDSGHSQLPGQVQRCGGRPHHGLVDHMVYTAHVTHKRRQPSCVEPLCLLCQMSCVVMFHHSVPSPGACGLCPFRQPAVVCQHVQCKIPLWKIPPLAAMP